MNKLKFIKSDSEHATFSSSSMGRDVACPISVYLNYDLPEPPRSPSAKEGTIWHELAAIYTEHKFEGKPYPEVEAIYNEDMKRYAKEAAEYCYRLIKDCTGGDYTYLLETKVIGDKDRDIWGTADFIFICKDENKKLHAKIVDFKYGVGIQVDTKENWQLIAYAYCLLNHFKGKNKFEDIEVHIFQPRIEEEAPPVMYDVEYLRKEKFPLIERTVDLIITWLNGAVPTDNDFKKYQRAGDHCQFCKAKGICKTYQQKYVGETVELCNKMIKEKRDIFKIEDVETGILSDEEITFITLNAGKIKKFIESVPKVATALLMNGESIKGIKLIEGNDKKEWIDNKDILVKGLKDLGIESPVVTTEKVITMTEAKKQLSKERAVELDKLTKFSGKNYRLVSESDDRDPVGFDYNMGAMYRQKFNNKK